MNTGILTTQTQWTGQRIRPRSFAGAAHALNLLASARTAS